MLWQQRLASRARSVHQDSDLMRLDQPGLIAFLQSCAARKDLQEGRRAHAFLERSNRATNSTVLASLLVKIYGKCGQPDEAKLVFGKIPAPNLYSWTMVITALARNGHPAEAVLFFRKMDLDGTRPDRVVLSIIVMACASVGELSQGMKLHERVVLLGVLDDVLRSSFINLYGNCGEISLARQVFDSLQGRNIVCWTAMITAFARVGHFLSGIELFWDWISSGVEPDVVTLVSAVDCCAGLGDLRQADAIHAHIVAAGKESSSEILANALVTMFVQCKVIDRARVMFDAMERRNVVVWTVMIAAYARIGQPREALELFQGMDLEGVTPDEVTVLGLVEGFAEPAWFQCGRMVHDLVAGDGRLGDCSSTAMIDMYARCGSATAARSVFDGMESRTTVAWTSMVAAYAHNGLARQAVEMSREMDLAGMSKNSVTFVTVLSACNHGVYSRRGCGTWRA